MQNLCLLITLAVYLTVEAAPAGLGSLEFDKLDTDLADLKYEVEEEDLDDFSKLLDEADKTSGGIQVKTDVDTSGYKTKTASNKGSKSKHNIEDLKKFYKTAGVQDRGAYDDDEVYAQAEGYTGTAVGVKGNEDRKYRKGSKTRGFHRVHHKDEYKKDKVFYEDDETSGVINKVGAKGLGYKLKAGAGFNKGHFHHDRQKGVFGKRGYSDKGFSDKEFSDYADSQGFDGTFSN
ncbi:Uncharacterized protein OBRU01_10274 [Operophtera brumata]|uniref:Uncharacterized protein n=1 Tax=Operophtera brumata TaxID=104452 RepID=A0A0L7LEA6_OPEBR|nr:Uncharacterized protein OBRU01_10274 [Operophtera brumata]